jgi:hypothetical protein
MTARRFTSTAGLTALAAVLWAWTPQVEAQTLGDVARTEEARRKGVKSGKVYTNDALRPDPGPVTAPASTPSAQPAPAPSPSGAGGAKPEDSTPAPDAKKDEAHWRERIKTERDALDRAQLFADSLQSRINGLSTDFSARDDPAQRGALSNDRQKAVAELDRVKKEIEQRTKAIADIQEEARKAGVPAGWVR